MIDPASAPTPFAAQCQYLWRSQGPERREPASICNHPAREGRECVGPFLEDITTDCGLWEVHPDSHLVPLPQLLPGKDWQRRRRRQGFDLHAGHGAWGVDWR